MSAQSTPETFDETVDRLNGTVDAACVEIDRLRTLNAELFVALKSFVTLYDGTRAMLGPSVTAKLAAAETAIAKAEGRS